MKQKNVKLTKIKSKVVREEKSSLTNFRDYWFKLDNAALIYPSSGNDNWNSVYRISANMKEEVDAEILQQAVEEIMPRFPTFYVQLKKGIFWYYFTSLNAKPKVTKESTYPCQKILLKSGRHLFRVMYFNKKIIFETFHSITDGYGAITFLTTLISKYLTLKGYEVNLAENIVSFMDKPISDEMEDSFNRFADLKNFGTKRDEKAYQIHGKREEKDVVNVITLRTNISDIKELAKKNNATITQLLVAVYLQSIIQYQKELVTQHKPVKISVPINLRNYFDSQTLRNFSSFINISVNDLSKDYTITELIEIVKEQMSKIDRDYLIKDMNFNVRPQKFWLVRIAPLGLKNVALKISYSLYGEKLYSSVISNLGKIKAPKEFEEHIESFDFILGKPKTNTISVGVIGFNDILSINFTSIITEVKVQRNFARILSGMGLKMIAETNEFN